MFVRPVLFRQNLKISIHVFCDRGKTSVTVRACEATETKAKCFEHYKLVDVIHSECSLLFSVISAGLSHFTATWIICGFVSLHSHMDYLRAVKNFAPRVKINALMAATNHHGVPEADCRKML